MIFLTKYFTFGFAYYIDILGKISWNWCNGIQIRFQNSNNPWLLLSFQLALAVPFQAALLIFVAFLTIFRLTRILLLLPCLYEFTIQSHPVSSLWINLLRDVFIDIMYKNVQQIFREIEGVQKIAELWYLIQYPNP